MPCLLYAANFESRTGYAWSTIELVFRGLGERLAQDGYEVFAAYPSLRWGLPEPLRGSSVEVIEFNYRSVRKSPSALLRFLRLVRERRVTFLYLTDQPTWSPLYPLFRIAGVRRILVHDRTSGDREPRWGVSGPVKRLLHRVPFLAGDCFVGVSDFVVRRLLENNGTPPSHTFRVYNGIDLSQFGSPVVGLLHERLGLPMDRGVVFFSGRAQAYKGLWVLLEAAHILAREDPEDPTFVCCGDGPALEDLQREVAARDMKNVVLTGRREDVHELLPSASVAVVPSIWAEAFGLAVIEAMAAGVPVVASRVGGIPELVRDGSTGILVTPGNAEELADAIRHLLSDESRRREIGARAKDEAETRFSIDRTVSELYETITPLL